MKQRENKYFQSLLAINKMVAFHEIYMESARQQLCKDECYDPRTAFKSMDSFRHNRVIPYELFSFFQLHRIESTVDECEVVIKSIDQSLGQMDYDSFKEMTLPINTTLRNLALARFDQVQIGVGSYSRLMFVKQHSEHVIALFLQKQLNFCRQFIFQKQEFCRQWGGDVYTLLQKLFKPKREILKFQQFYEIGREYRILFNENEFRSIWRRSKKGMVTLAEQSGQISLNFEQMHSLLLVGNFKTKKRYGLQQNVPIEKTVEKPICSYKVSHWKRHEEWENMQKQRQLQRMQELREVPKYKMKYSFAYMQSLSDPCAVRRGLKERSEEWADKVEGMSDVELIQAYNRITRHTIFQK